MSRYLVKFMKRVINDTGHEVDSCQFSVEALAPDRHSAREVAKKRFCEDRHLTHWSVHADRIEVSEAEFPS
jgi:hypothetical protein